MPCLSSNYVCIKIHYLYHLNQYQFLTHIIYLEVAINLYLLLGPIYMTAIYMGQLYFIVNNLKMSLSARFGPFWPKRSWAKFFGHSGAFFWYRPRPQFLLQNRHSQSIVVMSTVQG